MDLPFAAAPARRLLAVLPVLLAFGACDEAGPTEPLPAGRAAELTVDARSWAFADLAETATSVAVADPGTSPGWDIAFFATSVMLNGGDAGPGGVTGYCLCQNAGASDAQVMAMTPESQREAFESVTAAAIPAADSLWQTDALTAAVRGWYAYDLRTHEVAADSSRVWLVRTADSSPSFAKMRVRSIEGAAREHAGVVTLEYALQAAPGAPLGETRTLAVDLSSGARVHVDLASGSISDASDWDLALEGYDIRVNGGVSGSGQAGAVLADSPFHEIADAGSAPASVYAADAYGGVFDTARWYRYDLAGNHQIWPTFQVYLIRRGSDVYKVQITGYYGADGTSRQITFRYAPLAG